LVPTIHVTDLARMVKKVHEAPPERQYIFGIDNTRKPTQKKLIQAISDGIGTGLTECIDIPVEFDYGHAKLTPIQLEEILDAEHQSDAELTLCHAKGRGRGSRG
jgi:nucleoside-diphosphate-sugar epimerase